MSSQRHSCERCRHQKVRCMKSTEMQDGVTSCERCLRAGTPCIYSPRPRPPRASRQRTPATTPLSGGQPRQDLNAVTPGSDISGSFPGDSTFPPLDMAGLEDNDLARYIWDNNHTLNSIFPPALTGSTNNSDTQIQQNPGESRLAQDIRYQQDEGQSVIDSLTGRLMDLSNRVTRATSQLKCSIRSSPLKVDSDSVHEAFEASNSLVRIINSMPLATHMSTPPSTLIRDNDLPQPPMNYSLVFTALASHQHVLTLLRTICHSVQQSLESFSLRSQHQQQQQQQVLHGHVPSLSQLAMVLQLLNHLTNRIAQSFRMGRRHSAGQPHEIELLHTNHTLTDGFNDRHSSADSVVALAQDVLKKLPDEHVMLAQTVRNLQTRVDEVQY